VNRLALLAVLATASPALAETPLPPKKKRPDPPPPPSPPDPIVDQAKNGNLESINRHQGINVTVALGGGFTVGFGIDNAVGRGPSGTLRIATVASDKLAFTAEAITLTLLHRVEATMDAPLKRDQDSNLLLGLQYYVNPTLWLRVAGGLGGYQVADTPKALVGPAGLASGGVDVVRGKRWAVGLEFVSIAMLNRDGLLSSNAFLLALNFE
jgi:hypothetical protein